MKNITPLKALNLAPWLKKVSNVSLTIGLAFKGAVAAYFIGLPLPWLIGPLFLLTLLSMSGVRLSFPETIKEPIIGLLGVYLGSSLAWGGSIFQPVWTITLILMVVFTLMATLTGYFYFHCVAKYSQKEAFLSALPGALAYISAYIIDSKLPPIKIILSQSMRVLILVGLAPFAYQWATGKAPTEINRLNFEGLADFGWLFDLLIIIFLSIPTLWLLMKTQAPNVWFLGGLGTSLFCYAIGLTDEKLPHWFLQCLLILIGAMIGLRLNGINIRQFLNYTFHGIVATLILLCLTFLTSIGIANFFDLDSIKIFLAFAPGGVHEMAIIAFAYSIEPIFVTFHHVFRIFVVSALVPLFINRLKG